MKRWLVLLVALLVAPAFAQQPPVENRNAPLIAFDWIPDFFKITPDMNFGEVLSVAVNSKGTVVVLNHPGTSTAGPLYGNATTQLWEFDRTGKFVREIGKGVYGLGYAHSVRFDRYDNLWVVDKGTNAAMKFNPAGYVTMNLGRRPEGYEGEYQRPPAAEAKPADGMFNGPTDVAWDPDDNIYIGDGYGNSRIAKFDKNGNWVRTWGTYGPGGDHANENPGQIRNPHNLQVDKQGIIYVGDRGNRRIQVFDGNGQFLRFMFLNVPYDKKRHPVLGNQVPNPPDETAPWALCMTTSGSTQYLFVADAEPGRIYKMTLDGKILGMLGESGRGPRQFNWIHGLSCPSENELFVADMNNWRVVKIVLHPERTGTSANQ